MSDQEITNLLEAITRNDLDSFLYGLKHPRNLNVTSKCGAYNWYVVIRDKNLDTKMIIEWHHPRPSEVSFRVMLNGVPEAAGKIKRDELVPWMRAFISRMETLHMIRYYENREKRHSKEWLESLNDKLPRDFRLEVETGKVSYRPFYQLAHKGHIVAAFGFETLGDYEYLNVYHRGYEPKLHLKPEILEVKIREVVEKTARNLRKFP